jgi:hypothetical protein
MSGCDGCNHKGFREMIKKPYAYSGEIPCLTCSRFNIIEDRHTGAGNSRLTGGGLSALNLSSMQHANPDQFILDSVKGKV